MDFEFDLRKWAEFNSIKPTVLTVYMDLRQGPDMKFLARRGREIRDLYGDDREVRENFLEALRQAREFLGDEENIKSPGAAIIVDPSNRIFKTYDLPRPVDDQLVLDTSPYIRPLARLKEDWEPFGLVLMDNSQADLYIVNLSKVTDKKSIRTDALARQKNGGWSQARYSRRRKNKIEDFMKQVASELLPLLKKERVNRIILAGSADSKHKLLELLPERWRKRVVALPDISIDTSEDELLKKVFPVFFEAEKIEESQMILDLRDRMACCGLAVAGLEKTTRAVSEGRAERVMVKSGWKPEGWKCERCDVMEEGAEKDCVLCGERVYPVDMVEEIIEGAQKTAADVIFVREPNPVLEAMGNIAAFLRY